MHKIAAKVAKSLKKERSRTVVSLSDRRASQRAAQEAIDSVSQVDELVERGLQPIHAVYVHAQNLLSVFVEGLLLLPELGRFNDIMADAEDEYMPSGPPHSPITTSYFVTWSSFDLAFGLQKETCVSIVLDLRYLLKLDAQTVQLFEYFHKSRMGIYEHCGFDGDHLILQDILTQRRYTVYNASGYKGNPGELWFVRLLPNPLVSNNEAITFTTPYVLAGTPDDWMAFFQRGVWSRQKKAMKAEHQLKYGLTPCSWLEYIHQSYSGVNHENTAIFLTGFPDLTATRPHYSAKYTARLPEAPEG